MKPPKAEKIDFYDPLYEFVSFEEAAHDNGRSFAYSSFTSANAQARGHMGSVRTDENKYILPFLSSIEFNRQSFLRQSNLAFLVYPSGTHTRMAHSIGACYLGFLAAQRVAVIEATVSSKVGNPPEVEVSESLKYLAEFLVSTGWQEEFYLALLLHDIGHFPFSHTLENNIEFWAAFANADHPVISHEEAACQLIMGEGPIYDASRRRFPNVEWQGKCRHLADLFSQFPNIEKEPICYLISGSEATYLKSITERRKLELRVIHDLVSGLLDLDRIDHYRRDNYFTGLRAGSSLNFPSLLSGLTMCYEVTDPKKKPEIHLSDSAIGQAISLLQSKERLTEDCFEHPENIAYEVMLHQAFNMFILGDDFYHTDEPIAWTEELRKTVYDLLVSTDEQLLFRMLNEGTNAVQNIVFRIMNRLPYFAIAKLGYTTGHTYSVRDIRNKIQKITGIDKKDIVIRVFKNFGRESGKTKEFLNLKRLFNEKGNPLKDTRYERQIRHFLTAQDHEEDPLWIYTTDFENKEKLLAALPSIKTGLGCNQVEALCKS